MTWNPPDSFNARLYRALQAAAPKMLPYWNAPERLYPAGSAPGDTPPMYVLATWRDPSIITRAFPQEKNESLDAYAARFWRELIGQVVYDRSQGEVPMRQQDLEMALVNGLLRQRQRDQQRKVRDLKTRKQQQQVWQRASSMYGTARRDAAKRLSVFSGSISTHVEFISDYGYTPYENLVSFVERVQDDAKAAEEAARKEIGPFAGPLQGQLFTADDDLVLNPEEVSMEAGMDVREEFTGTETQLFLVVGDRPTAFDILFAWKAGEDYFKKDELAFWLRAVIRYHKIRMQRRFLRSGFVLPGVLTIEV